MDCSSGMRAGVIGMDSMLTPEASNTAHGSYDFRVFSDRNASDLEAFEWNSSMDLIACLTAMPDSTLSIYRLLYEEQSPKLLSEKVTGVGTALAWSPCGRKVAVGDRLGGIVIYDGETGAVLNTRRSHSRSVTTLSWVGTGTSADVEVEPPWSRMLPPLLAVPSAPSNMCAELPDADVEPSVADGFSLLISIDESGFLVISAGGTFPLLVAHVLGTQVPEPLSPPIGAPRSSSALSKALKGKRLAGRRPLAAHLSPDLRRLAVLISTESLNQSSSSGACSPRSPAQPSTSLGGPEAGGTAVSSSTGADVCVDATDLGSHYPSADDNVVLVLDVRKLATRRRELAQCSNMAERLIAVVGYARQAVDMLAHVWRGAADGFANKMRGLSEGIQAFSDGESTSVHEELLLSCCSGNPTAAVHAFLTRQTSAQQLIRLERTLIQALDYVTVVVSTRLQVADQHILTLLQELQACASWTQKFEIIGLKMGPLRELTWRAQEFNKLTELLLIQCSNAKRFVKTLFQVLLRMSQKVSDQPPASEPGANALSKEDMDDFVSRMQQRRSLELAEIASAIGSRGQPPSGTGAATASGRCDAAPGGTLDGESPRIGFTPGGSSSTPAASLTSVMHRLALEAEQVGAHITAAVSGHVGLLTCIPVRAPSPWNSITMPELRAAAANDIAGNITPPRGLGGTTLSMTWEPLGSDPCQKLILLWSGGGEKRAELHIGRVQIPLAPPATPAIPELEYAHLQAGAGIAHFTLCQLYDTSRVVAIVLEEQAAATGSAVATVCLLDISTCKFHSVKHLGGNNGIPVNLPRPVILDELPADMVKRSAPIPDSYVWACGMCAMASRGVCSIYARHARRLLTLDMEAEAEEDDENEEGSAD